MFNIQLYLEKFKNIGQGEQQTKDIVLGVVKDVAGINLEVKDILIKNGEINFKTSPAIKSVIFVKKEKILLKIKEKGIISIIDLR